MDINVRIQMRHLIHCLHTIADIELQEAEVYHTGNMNLAQNVVVGLRDHGLRAYRELENSFDFLDNHKAKIKRDIRKLGLKKKTEKKASDLFRRIHKTRKSLDGRKILKTNDLVAKQKKIKQYLSQGNMAKFKVEYDELQDLYVKSEKILKPAFREERQLGEQINDKQFKRFWSYGKQALRRLKGTRLKYAAAVALIALGLEGCAEHQHVVDVTQRATENLLQQTEKMRGETVLRPDMRKVAYPFASKYARSKGFPPTLQGTKQEKLNILNRVLEKRGSLLRVAEGLIRKIEKTLSDQEKASGHQKMIMHNYEILNYAKDKQNNVRKLAARGAWDDAYYEALMALRATENNFLPPLKAALLSAEISASQR